MKTDIKPRGDLRLTSCSYGLSKLQFRGPMRPTQDPYIAMLGGSETFAKFVAKPYPDLIETAIGEVCLNLGIQAAGPDAFLRDTAIHSMCHDAAAVVIQVVGAANLTNAFYKVHPRRNDRFIAPTARLTALYPEVDFADIAFTGHLVERLRSVDPVRFDQVRLQLQETWVTRMTAMVTQIKAPVVLLWFASRSPDDTHNATCDPVFVTRAMLERVRGDVSDVIEVVEATGNTDGMCHAPLDTLVARDMMGVNAHEAAAKALRAPLLHALT